MKSTNLSDLIKPGDFLAQAVAATSVSKMGALLKQLPIADESKFEYDVKNPTSGWVEGKLHWVPLGMDRGNAGRIKLATRPENPLAERSTNCMEALIEMARREELLKNPGAPMPDSPRQAVLRYFSLPPLDQLPRMVKQIHGKKPREYARDLARKIRVRAIFEKVAREFAVFIEDEGIGQTPARMHETLLSLGSSDKGDKPYLIGLFGQGGSSAYAASKVSWCISRRVSNLLDGHPDGVGWSAIKEVFPTARRDPYYAYLAAHPNGDVPSLPTAAADAIGLKHGTRFAHLGYNFAGGGSAVMRSLYYMLNHILYNPVLPFDLYAGTTEATIYGNGYRLSNASLDKKTALDKTFQPQSLDKATA
jgi:hypothetical protein